MAEFCHVRARSSASPTYEQSDVAGNTCLEEKKIRRRYVFRKHICVCSQRSGDRVPFITSEEIYTKIIPTI